MYSIALDLHEASIFMVAVSEKGEVVKSAERPTSPANLVELVQSVTKPRQVIVEESHLAQWAKDVLSGHDETVIVCDPRENHWIAKADHVDDRIAATKLARLAAMNCLKEIYHPGGDAVIVRSLMRIYYDASHEVTRHKNQLKAVFRSVAIRTKGSKIYQAKGRAAWLKKLEGRPDLELAARSHYKLMDAAGAMKREAFRKLHARCSKLAIYHRLLAMPGCGELIACGYIALIDDAARFSNERKLWSYAGLGNVLHESGGTTYKKGCSRSGNRILKWLVMQQFMAIQRRRKTSRFKEKNLSMLAGGHGSKDARRTVCRSILSVVRALWMSKKDYDDKHVSKPR
jgi:transposase